MRQARSGSPAEAIAIRAEAPEDVAAIEEVISRAYAEIPYSDHTEQVMVERLRSSSHFIPKLSLVALLDSQVVGHILLTRIAIQNTRRSVPSLALAPLSVVPNYQGLGVGSSLVNAAHDQATDLGFQSIILVGIPGYYLRFGYEPMQQFDITVPFSVPDDQRLVRQLTPNALSGVHGMVQYPRDWTER